MTIQPPSRIAIVIASTGRPVELGRWIDHLRRQTVQPTILVCAVVKPTDLPDWEKTPDNVKVVLCAPGLPIQRNAALEEIMELCDIVAFFDDDYVPSRYCVEGIERFFRTHPDIVAANGVLLADGINSPGISYEEARELVLRHDNLLQTEGTVLHELKGLYGCNMVFRATAIGQERFDEELPLYAWQEDIDFTARVGRHGRMVKTSAFCGVHQGVKGARLPGTRLGYSQIVNPIYMVRKGTLPAREAVNLILKNFLMNHARSLLPEPWVDRLGRCKGNWLAISDLLTGRDHPRNILTLPR
jgi:GT2 family glycosyltransferase